jgi:nitroimidazol reductase NimA-like FMN-containing flavoprotein (pyridoxamine 5'-phosphate oxidase superfamily)
MRTRSPARPALRALSESESKTVLGRNHVGRIVFSSRDSVDVLPIGYVFRDGWLFCRMSPLEKPAIMRHEQAVAFEVDEMRNQSTWTSVVVRGTLYELDEKGSPFNRRARDFALRLLRSANSAALSIDDSAASRTQVFGIAIQSISGRQCHAFSPFEKVERLDQPA